MCGGVVMHNARTPSAGRGAKSPRYRRGGRLGSARLEAFGESPPFTEHNGCISRRHVGLKFPRWAPLRLLPSFRHVVAAWGRRRGRRSCRSGTRSFRLQQGGLDAERAHLRHRHHGQATPRATSRSPYRRTLPRSTQTGSQGVGGSIADAPEDPGREDASNRQNTRACTSADANEEHIGVGCAFSHSHLGSRGGRGGLYLLILGPPARSPAVAARTAAHQK